MKKVLLLLTLTACSKAPPDYYCNSTQVSSAPPIYSIDQSVTPFNTTTVRDQCLPAYTFTLKDYERRVVYSVHLTNLKAGDVIMFNAVAQVTNELPYNTLVAWYTDIGQSPLDLVVSPDGTRWAMGYNVSSEELHHGSVADSGTFVIAEDTDEIYLNFCMYAGNSRESKVKEYLMVDPGYGKLSGVVFRNNGGN